MKMKQEMRPTLKQKQVLTMKQQQDLKILSFSSSELQTYIEEQVESNPLLEQDIQYETGYIQKCERNFELMMNYVIQEQTLSEVLQEQIHQYNKPLFVDLAVFLADLLDDNGYLPYSNKAIQRYFPQYSYDDIEETINILQSFEPSGVGARNLQECLLIQLANLAHPYAKLAILLVNEYLSELAQHKLTILAKKLDVAITDIQEALKLIQSLHPKPGSMYAATAVYLNPDVYVACEDGEITIELFRNTYGLRMNMEDFPAHYEEMKDYLKQEKKKAESLLNGIKKRSDTLLHLTKAIVAHQLPFFTEGKPLQPLTMKTIADALSMHESTISRCVASKSMIFQNQTIPLKYFFVHSLSNDSVKEVQERLKELIRNEDHKKPYSDQKLCDILLHEGYTISRRTIAKYLDEFKIPSAAKRKSYES